MFEMMKKWFSLLHRKNLSAGVYIGKDIRYLFACAYPWESSAQVSYVLGGVARNVAECISKLGEKPFMISALGLDMPGGLLTFFCLLLQLLLSNLHNHKSHAGFIINSTL